MATLIDKIRSHWPEETLPICTPEFTGREITLFEECLNSGLVSTSGKFLDLFETDLGKITQSHAIATNSGSSALQGALHLMGIPKNSEVLIPSLAFVAPANEVRHFGAIPHFVEVEEGSLGIDPKVLLRYLRKVVIPKGEKKINRLTGRPISAMIPIHMLGHCCDMDALMDIALEFDLKVIEDASEALGSRYLGRPAGSLGHIGILSFNGNKILTTGGGGALLLANPEIAAHGRHLFTTAKIQHPWKSTYNQVGFNIRMPSLNAAVGVAQLEDLDRRLVQKRSLAATYEKLLSDWSEGEFVKEPSFSRSNYWLNAAKLGNNRDLDSLMEEAHRNGIYLRKTWDPIHTLKPYNDCPRMDLTLTEDLFSRMILLPSNPKLAIHG